ncbi:hypothetical protein BGZ65_005909, partial [Modicella reniformis]
MSTYDFTTSSWSTTTIVDMGGGFKAVTDPVSGLIYVPGGPQGIEKMLVYNPETEVFHTGPMPMVDGYYASRDYALAWCKQRNS